MAGPELARLLTEKLATLDAEDLFQVLGVARDASRPVVKAAYLAAAKNFHPDRFTAAGLAALKSDAEKVFRKISEANATLSDDSRRAAYLTRLSAPVDSGAEVQAQRAMSAELSFMEGEVALKRRDYETAIRLLTEVVGFNPGDGESLALLAWARFSSGRAQLAALLPDFGRAVQLAPACARAHYYLGMALKSQGDVQRAIGSFKRAADLDPRLAEAQSELRVLTMRSTRVEKEPPPKGLFDRLRKK